MFCIIIYAKLQSSVQLFLTLYFGVELNMRVKHRLKIFGL